MNNVVSTIWNRDKIPTRLGKHTNSFIFQSCGLLSGHFDCFLLSEYGISLSLYKSDTQLNLDNVSAWIYALSFLYRSDPDVSAIKDKIRFNT